MSSSRGPAQPGRPRETDRPSPGAGGRAPHLRPKLPKGWAEVKAPPCPPQPGRRPARPARRRQHRIPLSHVGPFPRDPHLLRHPLLGGPATPSLSPQGPAGHLAEAQGDFLGSTHSLFQIRQLCLLHVAPQVLRSYKAESVGRRRPVRLSAWFF